MLARRIARKTLLAVTGLVSIHDGTWTTARVAAARRFGVIQPRWADALGTLTAWGGGGAPRPSRADVRHMLDGAVAAVVDEFESRIGRWRPDEQTQVG